MALKGKVKLVADDALNVQELGGRRVEKGEMFEVSHKKATELKGLRLAHDYEEPAPTVTIEEKEGSDGTNN